MTTADQLHAALLVRLQGILTISTFDGKVPENPPVDPSGLTLPYAVVWPSAGHYPRFEAGELCDEPGPELAWVAQVTVAAGKTTWCLQAAGLVTSALVSARLLPGTTRLRADEASPPVSVDPDVTPARVFVPLFFRTLTT